jgi:hypothetical protein
MKGDEARQRCGAGWPHTCPGASRSRDPSCPVSNTSQWTGAHDKRHQVNPLRLDRRLKRLWYRKCERPATTFVIADGVSVTDLTTFVASATTVAGIVLFASLVGRAALPSPFIPSMLEAVRPGGKLRQRRSQ